MFSILSLIPGRKKKTMSGWTVFNCPCCHHLGHRPDKRARGAIKFDGSTNFVMKCFNCHYTCGFTMGRSISSKTRQLLEWCGVDQDQVQRWSLESMQHRDLLDLTIKKVLHHISFSEVAFPEAEPLNLENPDHLRFIEYLERRKIPYDSYPFMVTPHDSGRNAHRIIIPYSYQNKIVGYTNRFLDDKLPKYLNHQQPGYVFGYDFQKPNWEAVILVEGIFDALSIDACALTHDTISDDQARVLAQLNRQVIMVPDRDKAGLDVCDRALELGYSVSLPNWAPGIKDTNDACLAYGRLPTLLSILQSATRSKIKIQMRKNQIDRI